MTKQEEDHLVGLLFHMARGTLLEYRKTGYTDHDPITIKVSRVNPMASFLRYRVSSDYIINLRGSTSEDSPRYPIGTFFFRGKSDKAVGHLIPEFAFIPDPSLTRDALADTDFIWYHTEEENSDVRAHGREGVKAFLESLAQR